MEITLNHTIIPSHGNVESAKFYERIFGFNFLKEWKYFAVVKANSTLTLDFMNKDNFTINHYAFKVSETQFDEILERIKSENIQFSSDPYSAKDEVINHDYDGRGVYFEDPGSHLLEIDHARLCDRLNFVIKNDSLSCMYTSERKSIYCPYCDESIEPVIDTSIDQQQYI